MNETMETKLLLTDEELDSVVGGEHFSWDELSNAKGNFAKFTWGLFGVKGGFTCYC